jgi:hypothetical protein
MDFSRSNFQLMMLFWYKLMTIIFVFIRHHLTTLNLMQAVAMIMMHQLPLILLLEDLGGGPGLTIY